MVPGDRLVVQISIVAHPQGDTALQGRNLVLNLDFVDFATGLGDLKLPLDNFLLARLDVVLDLGERAAHLLASPPPDKV